MPLSFSFSRQALWILRHVSHALVETENVETENVERAEDVYPLVQRLPHR